MIDIDKLRYTYEKPFLELMDGMEKRVHPDFPHRTLWYKEDGWYFEQDEKNGTLWCQYNRVWSFFEIEYGGNYVDIQSIIRNLMKRHYNLRGLTPSWLICHASGRWKDITN